MSSELTVEHSHECVLKSDLRTTCGVLACLSAVVVASSLYYERKNPTRARYPGRIVTCLGSSLFLFNCALALGLIAFNWRQLDWAASRDTNDDGDDDDNVDNDYEYHYWKSVCEGQGWLVVICTLSMAFYSCWLCLAFYSAVYGAGAARKRRRRLKRRQSSNNNNNAGAAATSSGSREAHSALLIQSLNAKERKRWLRQEALAHLAIVGCSVGAASLAFSRGDLGWDTGIPACWVVGRTQQV